MSLRLPKSVRLDAEHSIEIEALARVLECSYLEAIHWAITNALATSAEKTRAWTEETDRIGEQMQEAFEEQSSLNQYLNERPTTPIRNEKRRRRHGRGEA